MTYNAPPAEMKRFDYASVEVPGEAGSSPAPMPALPIRMRPFDTDPTDFVKRMVQADAMLDTGASVSSVPMWSLDRLGIAVDKKTRQPVFGPSGGYHAYDVKIGAEIEHSEGWLDIGAISVLVPDTEQSRDPAFHIPFLLGRRGFFDKFDMCISESQKALWLRRIGGWAQGAS